MSERVFITGMGLLSAAGLSVDETWRAVLNGETHLGPIQSHDLSTWPVQIGGELKNFQPLKCLPDRKLMKAISYQDAIGIVAAGQAITQSKIIEAREKSTMPELFNDRTGVYVGSPGNKYLQQYDFLPLLAKSKDSMQAFANHLFDEVHPMWLLRILPNNVLAYTGILYGFKGPNHNIANHAVGGMQALLEAFYAVKSGQIDRAVVVAYDCIDPQALFYYTKLGLLSNDALRPFDKNANGTVLADGGAALVIETEASLKTSGAAPLAEILAGHTSTEGKGAFGLDHEAAALTESLTQTLNKAHVMPNDLAFVVAHGNGSKGSDQSEALAYQRCFNEYPLPITGFKWCMGHTLVASGLVDTILATSALNHKILPGLTTLHTPLEQAKSLHLHPQTQAINRGNIALITNRGFGSMNATLAIKAP